MTRVQRRRRRTAARWARVARDVAVVAATVAFLAGCWVGGSAVAAGWQTDLEEISQETGVGE